MATEAENFLGGGFAGAAGDSQNFRVAARARGARQILKPALGVGDRQKRTGRAFRLAAHQRGAGLSRERGATKSWPSR